MIKHWWWKILAVILLAYSIIAGLLIPLRPGILRIDNDRAEAGQLLEMRVTGYNTHFKSGGPLRAWLKLDEQYAIRGEVRSVEGERFVALQFAIPELYPYQPEEYDLSLVMDNPEDGAFVLPGAVFVLPRSVGVDEKQGPVRWSEKVDDLHDRAGIHFPFRNILYETIRNTYYHVPLWFAMIIILAASMVFSVRYLQTFRPENDMRAAALARVGLLFGILGLLTGAVWANYSWGRPWSNDIKQLVSAIALLIYMAYFVLRMAFDSPEQKSRISAIFNIFAFVALIPLLFVIPRLSAVDSLHPGNAGNPGFGGEDLDNTMRLVFYPAIIGWTLLGLWMANLSYRYFFIREWMLEEIEMEEEMTA